MKKALQAGWNRKAINHLPGLHHFFFYKIPQSRPVFKQMRQALPNTQPVCCNMFQDLLIGDLVFQLHVLEGMLSDTAFVQAIVYYVNEEFTNTNGLTGSSWIFLFLIYWLQLTKSLTQIITVMIKIKIEPLSDSLPSSRQIKTTTVFGICQRGGGHSFTFVSTDVDQIADTSSQWRDWTSIHASSSGRRRLPWMHQSPHVHCAGLLLDRAYNVNIGKL